jgi:glycosyltransferase involved in cell wall biosynthesis
MSLGLDPDKNVIGYAGWLLPIKGPVYLIDAIAQIVPKRSDIQLVLAGKGDQEMELRARARQMKVDQYVTFVGWRPDIHEIMPLFDLFVLPSLNEGMGRVLVEAMAAGKPVIASDTGGIPDLVKHGVNGLLFPPGDEVKLAEHISYLISHPDVAKTMGDRGREMCRRFSLESMIRKLDRLYEDLLGSTNPSNKRCRPAKPNASTQPMIHAG